MDYFTKFLRPGSQVEAKPQVDHLALFSGSWNLVKNTLLHPDERQLTRGIASTDVPAHLKIMVDELVWESTRMDEATTGACLEFLLKNDVLGTLVRLSESDRPVGIQAEVLRTVCNMVVLLDEQFLVHSAVHKAVIRLLRACVGDEIEERVDTRVKPMGAASATVKTAPSDYELDLVDLLCILCSRIRTYPDLLLIFFHDKNWFQSQERSLASVIPEEENEDVDSEDEEEANDQASMKALHDFTFPRTSSPTPSSTSTVTSAPTSSAVRKPEYEFLIFNYLLRFVHREGQIGDFARAGLLFLIDVAMSACEKKAVTEDDHATQQQDPVEDAALALAEYILDGDFAQVLGAGLGAVFSLLPSKLEIKREKEGSEDALSGMHLGETPDDETAKNELTRYDLESSTNPDFRARLDHFLKLMEFVQDVLRRNSVGSAAASALANADSSDNSVVVLPSALVGSAIAQSILDAFRSIFLKNVLYPSILECSDFDGSAVAVMAYIDTVLQTLHEDRMTDLLVQFLMSEEDDLDLEHLNKPNRLQPPRRIKEKPKSRREDKLRRRKSSAMVLLELEAPKRMNQSAYFSSLGRFTLKDLMLSTLRSRSQPTGTEALRLLQTLLKTHCHLTVDGLLTVAADPLATSFPRPSKLFSSSTLPPPPRPDSPESDEDEDAFVYPGADTQTEYSFQVNEPYSAQPLFVQPQTTVQAHDREVELYLSLISKVDKSRTEEVFSTGYDNYLRDAVDTVKYESCFQACLHSPDEEPSNCTKQHRLLPTDTLLKSLLQTLRLFFSHTPEFNVALTGVIASICACPRRSVAGWLTFAQKSDDSDIWQLERKSFVDEDDEDDEDGDDRSIDFGVNESFSSGMFAAHMLSRNDPNSLPVLYSIYSGLVSQLERYRRQVEDFDRYLSERRQGLLFAENLNDALNLVLEFDSPKPSTKPLPKTTAQTTPTKPKSKSRAPSFVTSLFSPKSRASASNRSGTSTPPSQADPTTPPRTKVIQASSPFTPHYQQTSAIDVRPFVGPPPSVGAWSPAQQGISVKDVFSADDSFVQEDQEDDEVALERRAEVRVTLSQVLDNVVILEESIKELAALVQVRSSLGIDAVRYL